MISNYHSSRSENVALNFNNHSSSIFPVVVGHIIFSLMNITGEAGKTDVKCFNDESSLAQDIRSSRTCVKCSLACKLQEI